jgi:hypothetical protein
MNKDRTFSRPIFFISIFSARYSPTEAFPPSTIGVVYLCNINTSKKKQNNMELASCQGVFRKKKTLEVI